MQIPRFHDGFPKEKEEKEDDEENECTFHHVRQIDREWEGWVGSVEENLRSIEGIPHDQQRHGVDTHDGKENPCLVGKPSPADDGDQYLEELESIDGQNTI